MLLTRVGVDSAQVDVSIAMVFIGAGMGFGFIATMLSAQNSVDLPRMGVATGLVNFTRQLGGVFGVAVGAALMLTTLTNRLTEAFPNAHIKAAELLSPAAAERFPAATQDIVRARIRRFARTWCSSPSLVIALLGVLTVALMPGGKPEGHPRRRARRRWPRPCCPTARPSSSRPRRRRRRSRRRGVRLRDGASGAVVAPETFTAGSSNEG